MTPPKKNPGRPHILIFPYPLYSPIEPNRAPQEHIQIAVLFEIAEGCQDSFEISCWYLELHLAVLQRRITIGALRALQGLDRGSGEEFQICGLGGVWGVILILNFNKRVAQKLRRIILLHLGLVTSRFHSGKTRTVIIFMIFGASEHVHVFQNQSISTLGPPSYLTKTKDFPNHFETYYSLNVANFSGKCACRQILKFRLIHSLKSCIWNQYFQEDMNGGFRNFSERNLKHLNFAFIFH